MENKYILFTLPLMTVKELLQILAYYKNVANDTVK